VTGTGTAVGGFFAEVAVGAITAAASTKAASVANKLDLSMRIPPLK